MNELLERRVREIYAQDAEHYDPTDAVLRLRNHHFPVRTSRPRRRLWAALGTSGTALTGGAVAAAVALSSGASIAYAGWNSVPNSPTPETIASTSAVCAQTATDSRVTLTGSSAAALQTAFNGQPALAESRGIYVSLVEISDGQLFSCLTHGSATDPKSSFSLTMSSYGAVQPAPAADQISAIYPAHSAYGQSSGDTPLPENATPQQIASAEDQAGGGGYGPSILGQVGSGVSSVTVTLDNDQTVVATVQNGWYFAWWPWGTTPKSITVATTSGTTTTSAATIPYEGKTSTGSTSTQVS